MVAADRLNFHTYYFVITFVCVIFASMDSAARGFRQVLIMSRFTWLL